jgi:hypothetical protein
VLENEYYSIYAVVPKIVTAHEAEAWDLVEGQTIAHIIAAA